MSFEELMDNVDQAIDMLLERPFMSERTAMVAVFRVDGLPAYQFSVKQIVNNFHVDDHELDIHVVSKNGSAQNASELFFDELVNRGLVGLDAEVHLQPWSKNESD